MEVFPINVELVSCFLKLLSNLCTCAKNNTFFGKFFLFLTTDVIDVSPFHKIRLFDLIGEAKGHFVFSFLRETQLVIECESKLISR